MPTFIQTNQGYDNLWRQAAILPSWRARACAAADRVRAGMTRYAAVEAATGVPRLLVGVLHHMESSCNFSTHLHNGDPLTTRTRHEPAGRPHAAPRNGRSYTWEESATDALAIKGLIGLKNWSIPFMCYTAEGFNGWGYLLYRKINSPYLWNGTTLQQCGKYVADGVWDPHAWSQQVGVVAILKILMEEEPVQNLKEILEPFDHAAPLLMSAIGTKYEGIAGMALAAALRQVGETATETTPAAIAGILSGLGLSKVLEVMQETEKTLSGVVPAVVPPMHEVPMLAVEPPPPVEPTVLDLLFGNRLTGYKTYITIVLAGVVNVVAALGVFPELLTPTNLAAINAALATIGGASLVSKIERYAQYAAVFKRI